MRASVPDILNFYPPRRQQRVRFPSSDVTPFCGACAGENSLAACRTGRRVTIHTGSSRHAGDVPRAKHRRREETGSVQFGLQRVEFNIEKMAIHRHEYFDLFDRGFRED